ncbi:MAG: hypothetical protein KAY32_11415 [Candidatus Eisenbacteria sp.]|nr:hypothetical protein [Candidatus Eisenbacteria bacterium]
MAVVRRNSMLDGVSGTIGDLVFRVRGEKTIVARRPGPRRDAETPSAARAGTLSAFRRAVAFAREARTRPAFRSLARMGRAYSPYHVAIQDFLSHPVIERVDVGAWGPVGCRLTVHASERIAVRSVRAVSPGGAAPGVSGERIARNVGGPPQDLEEFTNRRSDGNAAGSATSPPADAMPAGRPSTSAGRPSIPAEVFFRRPSSDRRPADRHPPPPNSAGMKPAGPLPGATRYPGVPREGEGRCVPRHVPREEEGRSAKVEWSTWRLWISHPGEVDIIASDYAGNRTVRRLSLTGPDA